MREPRFWWRPPARMSLVLSPLGRVYGAVAGRRMMQRGRAIGIPVICVGNYQLGGAGKTPTVLALASFLKEEGQRPFALTRGYGGTARGPLRVDADLHSSDDVGDEPLLLARALPVIVARDRAAGAEAARQAGATIVLMDDGFQNPALQKDLRLAVIDSGRGVGNGEVFPAGPLRAPLAVQVAATDLLVVVGNGQAADAVAEQVAARGGEVLRARLEPDPARIARLRDRRVLAFAGIGDPERFFATLRTSGIEIGAARVFPDHHRYRQHEIEHLVQRARRDGLSLVTTEKDLVKLQGIAPGLRSGIAALAVSMVFDDPDRLRRVIRRALSDFSGRA